MNDEFRRFERIVNERLDRLENAVEDLVESDLPPLPSERHLLLQEQLAAKNVQPVNPQIVEALKTQVEQMTAMLAALQKQAALAALPAPVVTPQGPVPSAPAPVQPTPAVPPAPAASAAAPSAGVGDAPVPPAK